jgi:hypothetical protein
MAMPASCSVTGSLSLMSEHRLLNAQRLAQVALQHPAYPVGIAHRQRLVEVHLFLQVGNDLGVLLFAGQDQGRITRQQLLQPKNDEGDKKHGGHQGGQPFEEIVQHVLTANSGRALGKTEAVAAKLGDRLTRRTQQGAYIFTPCTRTRPSGMVLKPVSFLLWAHNQLRW